MKIKHNNLSSRTRKWEISDLENDFYAKLQAKYLSQHLTFLFSLELGVLVPSLGKSSLLTSEEPWAISLQNQPQDYFSAFEPTWEVGIWQPVQKKSGLFFSLELCVTSTLGGLSHQLIWQSCLAVKCPKEASSASVSAPWAAWWRSTCTASILSCCSSGTPLCVWERGCLQQTNQHKGIRSWRNSDYWPILSLSHLQSMKTSLSPCPWTHLLLAYSKAEEMESKLLCVGVGFALKGARTHGDGCVGATGRTEYAASSVWNCFHLSEVVLIVPSSCAKTLSFI